MPLKDIADLILRVNVRGYSLEMANPRHEHEWRVWETVKLPDGKVLLSGVVSHATNVVEHPELVTERLVRLLRLIVPERVIASTDCGLLRDRSGVGSSLDHVGEVTCSFRGATLASRALGFAAA